MNKSPFSSSDIKKNNRRNVMQYILLHNECTRQEIAYSQGISLPTVFHNVETLIDSGLVIDCGQSVSTGGRKASIVSAKIDTFYSVGLEITKNHIGLIMINIKGNIILEERISLVFSNTKDYYLALKKYVILFVNKTKINKKKIKYIGISIPGILNRERDKILDSHVLNIKDLSCEVFSDMFECETYFENDANASGYAELKMNNDYKTMFYFSLSNSVGGSLYIDNNLYEGLNGFSGEVGHMRIGHANEEQPKCYCGQLGCLDAYCSALVLQDEANGSLDEFFKKLKSNEKYQAKFKEYQKNLALAVCNVQMLLDCNIVIGGYVGKYFEPYIDEFKKMVTSLNPFGQENQNIFCTKSTDLSSAYGVALKPINDYLEQL